MKRNLKKIQSFTWSKMHAQAVRNKHISQIENSDFFEVSILEIKPVSQERRIFLQSYPIIPCIHSFNLQYIKYHQKRTRKSAKSHPVSPAGVSGTPNSKFLFNSFDFRTVCLKKGHLLSYL